MESSLTGPEAATIIKTFPTANSLFDALEMNDVINPKTDSMWFNIKLQFILAGMQKIAEAESAEEVKAARAKKRSAQVGHVVSSAKRARASNKVMDAIAKEYSKELKDKAVKTNIMAAPVRCCFLIHFILA